MLLLAALAAWICKRACAGTRHLIWGLGLAGVLLITLATVAAPFLPQWRIGSHLWADVWPVAAGAEAAARGTLTLVGLEAPLAGAQLDRLADPAALAGAARGASGGPALSWLTMLALIWGIGCAGLLVRLVRDLLTARQLVRGRHAGDQRLAV